MQAVNLASASTWLVTNFFVVKGFCLMGKPFLYCARIYLLLRSNQCNKQHIFRDCGHINFYYIP